MVVCVDGNDGTGKTSLVERLRRLYPDVEFQDRGLPTAMTIGEAASPADLYLVLDASPETCQERLRAVGKSVDEPYHALPDLIRYRARFREVAAVLGAALLDAEPPLEAVASAARDEIDRAISARFISRIGI